MCAELLGMIDCLKCKFSEEDFAFDEETGKNIPFTLVEKVMIQA